MQTKGRDKTSVQGRRPVQRRRVSRTMRDGPGNSFPEECKQSNGGRNGTRHGRSGKSGRGRAPLGVNHKLWLKKLPAKEQEYLNAALSGDIATLKRVIDAQEVDLNVVDSFGHTALMNASWKDRGEAVKLLLDTGVELDCRNNDGQTAMDKAAYWGFTKILQLLLDAGSSIDVRNNNGETPLHRAASWGHVDAVKLLLNAKANGNEFKNQRRYTPLHFAAKHGKPEVIRVLLEGKCDPFRRDSCGRTPIELAKRNKKQEVYRLLKEWQRGHEGNTCEEIYSAIMKIEKAGNWDAPATHHDIRHLKIDKEVCTFNLDSLPSVTNFDAGESTELLFSIVENKELELRLALVTTSDEILSEDKILSVHRQNAVTLTKTPNSVFTVEQQEGVSSGLQDGSPRTNHVFTFQRVDSLHVDPSINSSPGGL